MNMQRQEEDEFALSNTPGMSLSRLGEGFTYGS